MNKPLSYLTTLILFLTISLNLSAQDAAPHISGTVYVRMSDGLIKADLELSNLPKLGTDYKILLHRGMNIKLITDTAGVLNYEGHYAGKMNGEGVEYTPTRVRKILPLPGRLKISYTGAYPVYGDTLNAFDYKGVIAFNGKTLRASEQSKWYPIIYDVKNDKELSDVTYKITVISPDAKSIYINGSEAQPGPKATLSSSKPRDLILFTGNYDIQKFPGTDFLNAGMTAEQATVFDANLSSIRKFYEKMLKRPYGDKITFMQHTAVEPFSPKRSWGFVTFPTVAIAGGQFKNQVNLQTKMFTDTSLYSFYAHELGHYYFGSVLTPNSTLRWFFLESMAEFLSIKATEAKYGKVTTEKWIKAVGKWIKTQKVTPLPKIEKADNIGDTYRYNYGPLMLLAMEKRFGAEKVNRFLQTALKHAGEKTDYAFLKQAVAEAGISNNDWTDFEQKVINQESCAAVFDYL